MYWEKSIETLGRDSLQKLQLDRLKKTISNANKSQFYNKRFQSLDFENIKTFEDFHKIPFTVKQDLRDHFPYGLLTKNLNEIIRLHSSSGTTGNPTVILHTKKDIEVWSDLMARSMYMTGVRENDIFQNIMGYGLFTGGLGFHYGAEKLGMMTIPIGPGNSKRQIWFMKEFKTSVVHFLPSYALRLSSFFGSENIDIKRDLSLRIGFVGAEPHTDAIRKKIEELYNIKAYNSYGLSEMNGPGVAFECEYQEGMHIWEDAFYPEIIDPVTGKVLPDGEEGELVLTTLRREAMPIIRYRTRDLTRIISEPCKCGRTHRRIDRIKGRSDDMLIINGVNIFPMQIEKTLMNIGQIGNDYIIEIYKENFLDKVHVKVEVNKNAFEGTLNDLERLKGDITGRLKSELGVNPVVHLVEPGSLPENTGKAVRVFDYRGQK